MVIRIKENSEQPKPLGRYLVEAGLISLEQLQSALAAQQLENKRLGEILVDRGWINQQTLEDFIEEVVSPERNLQKTPHLIHQHRQYKLQPIDAQKLAYIPRQILKILVSPQKTSQLLFFIAVALLGAHLVGQFTEHFLPDYFSRDFLAELFNLDRELNIPTLYAMALLLISSILSAVIAYAKHVRGDRLMRYWGGLSIVFLCLAIDEITSLHERMTVPLRSALNTSGLLYYAWVIPGIVFVVLCLLTFSKLLLNLPTKTRRLILVAGSIFVCAAIGIESLGGYYATFYGEQNMTYAVIVGIEEFLEMVGVILFIYALLSYIDSAMKGLSVRFEIIAPKRIASTQFSYPNI